MTLERGEKFGLKETQPVYIINLQSGLSEIELQKN